MDKWKETSLFDIDWKTTTDSGEEVTFTFKPLLGKDFVKAFGLFNKLSDMPEQTEGETDEAFSKRAMASMDEEFINKLYDVASTVVSRSYPDKKEDEVNAFVGANLFDLIEPISKLVIRESKRNPRKADSLGK